MDSDEIIKQLKALKNPDNIKGMARFGIATHSALGIASPILRQIAQKIKAEHKQNMPYMHQLAVELWQTNIHEARKLAALIDVPVLVTEKQMEEWVNDFDSWDICDDVCGHLFDKTPFAFDKAAEWANRDKEFVRRAGFAMMAWLSAHNKNATDGQFKPFFKIIEQQAYDDRNFVKKAVSWALRQIGKARPGLLNQALELAFRLKGSTDSSKRWIGGDAYRELSGYK